jgi:hypothetical protein
MFGCDARLGGCGGGVAAGLAAGAIFTGGCERAGAGSI